MGTINVSVYVCFSDSIDETNPVLKKKLYEKIEPYMTRAETIKSYLTAQKKDVHVGDVQVNMTTSLDSKSEEGLASALLVDKPNVSWNDVAGKFDCIKISTLFSYHE
jgi:hypothetical protein